MKQLLAIVLLIASPLFAQTDRREEATALFARAASFTSVPEDKPLHFHADIDM